jgi:hypothetical protein
MMKRAVFPSLLCALLLCTASVSAEPSEIPDDALVTYGYLQKELEALRQELLTAMEAQKETPEEPQAPAPSRPLPLPAKKPLSGEPDPLREDCR